MISILENTKWSSGSMMSLQKPGKGVPFNNTLKTEARGWAFMWLHTTIKTQAGRGLWISSVAGYFTPTAGLHCLRNALSMIARIRQKYTFQAVSYRLTTSGISGNQVLA